MLSFPLYVISISKRSSHAMPESSHCTHIVTVFLPMIHASRGASLSTVLTTWYCRTSRIRIALLAKFFIQETAASYQAPSHSSPLFRSRALKNDDLQRAGDLHIHLCTTTIIDTTVQLCPGYHSTSIQCFHHGNNLI